MMPFLSIPVVLFSGGTEEREVACIECRGSSFQNGLPCKKCNGMGKTLQPGEPPTEKQVQLRLIPQCIEAFYPCFYDGASMIVMMSGEKYMTPLSCEQIEAGILAYWKNVNEKMGAERPGSGRILSFQ